MPDQERLDGDEATDKDAVKAAFKEALDRKRQGQHPGADNAGPDRGNAHSTHAQGGKRQFRRKSGG